MRTKNGQYAIAIKRFAEMYYTEQGISPTVREIERRHEDSAGDGAAISG